MTRRRPRKLKFPKCPRWPRCGCIVRGYTNPREQNECGKRPSKPPKPVYVREQVGWD